MLLDSFLVKIGVNADSGKLKAFGDKLADITTKAGVLAGTLTASVGGAVAFVQKSLEGLDEIAQLSRVTGEATENIQLLGMIATTAGSSVQATNSSIEGLSRTIGEAVNGVGLGARAFENYGLSAKKSNGDIKSATELMDELRQKMKGMSEQSQIAMLAKLGIDKSMIQVLRMTNEEMAEAQENARKLSLGTGTQENVDESASLQDSLAEFWEMIKAVAEYISLKLSPAIRSVIEVFKQWFIVNNDDVKNSLKAIADNIAKLITWFANFVRALDNVISNTLGWKNAILLLAGAFTILSAILSPVYIVASLVMGAFVGIIALVDDFITYMNGGKSQLGDFWKPFVKAVKVINPYFKRFVKGFKILLDIWLTHQTNVLKSVGKIFSGLIDIFLGVFQFIAGILTGNTDTIMNGLKDFVEGVAETFSGIVDLIFLPFKTAFNSILNSNSYKETKEKFKGWIESIKNAFDGVIDFISLPFESAFNLIINSKTYKEIKESFKSWVKDIKNAFSKAIDFIVTPFENAFKMLKKMVSKYLDPIKKSINEALSFVGLGSSEDEYSESKEKGYLSKAKDSINNVKDNALEFFGFKKDSEVPKTNAENLDMNVITDKENRDDLNSLNSSNKSDNINYLTDFWDKTKGLFVSKDTPTLETINNTSKQSISNVSTNKSQVINNNINVSTNATGVQNAEDLSVAIADNTVNRLANIQSKQGL